MAVTDMYMQYGAAQQAQNNRLADTFKYLAEREREKELLEQQRLDAQRADAQKLSQDPAYILSQLSQGKEVTPYQKAILDVASAKSQRAMIDPNTGQLIQTGGFPSYGEQQTAQSSTQPSAQTSDVMPSLGGIELDEGQKRLLASATNPREQAEVRKQIMQEKFTMRGEERKKSEQQKKDLMQSKELKRTLDTLLKDPNLEEISGSIQGGFSSSEAIPAWMKSSAQRKLQPVVNKLKGQQFLQAYQGLRGGGQITEVEGRKAEQAQAALDQSMSDEDFKSALSDYSKVIENGIARMEGREPPHNFEEDVQGAPSIGAEMDGYRFKGGNPADQSNWEKI